jgi:hypothetical protein
MDRIQNRLKKTNSKLSINLDTNLPLYLTNYQKQLPPTELNYIVNESEQFNKERNESSRYRVISTINPLISNVLFNISSDKVKNNFGSTTNNDELSTSKSYGWETFNYDLFKQDIFKTNVADGATALNENPFLGRQDFTFEQSIKKHLKEINGWFGFFDPDETKAGDCSYYDLEPSRYRFEFNNNIKKNWDLTITYPYKNDTDHLLVRNGLLITTMRDRIFAGRNLIALGTCVKHNLSVGDKVRITNMPNSLLNGDYDVIGLGLEDGTLEEYYFVITLYSTDSLVAPYIGIGFNGGRMKRLYYNTEVKYYLRIFRKVNGYLTNKQIENDDYELFPVGFSKNIFNDSIYQVIFNEDIYLDGLKDNLNRPLSEIYLTILKTKSDGIFTSVMDGFDLANIEGNLKTNSDTFLNMSNIRKMHTLAKDKKAPFNSHIPLDKGLKVDINSSTFYGDLVEFSPYEFNETVLADVMHRFNTVDRELTEKIDLVDDAETDKNKMKKTIEGIRCEGYIYKPHHKIKIRSFSDYIETGDDTTSGMPEYKYEISPNTYIWRDFLDAGTSNLGENLDFPFVNGCHYLYKNIFFPVKRQDPFGQFDLYYEGDDELFSPKDIVGDSFTDKFNVNSSNDGC